MMGIPWRKIAHALRAMLVIVTISFSTSAIATETCGRDVATKYRHRSEISLVRKVYRPAFYLKSGDYALLVDAHQVDKLLEERIEKWHAPDDQALLTVYRQHLPLTRNVDLFEPALEGVQFYVRINLLVAEVIESGQAAIIDLRNVGAIPDPTIEAISVIRIGGTHAPFVGREFCTPEGDTFFKIIDEVID